MPRGDKSKYTEKQKRQAEHIAEGYEHRGVSEKEAEARAWATVNAETHGGKLPGGSGRGKAEDHEPSRTGGRRSQATRTKADRSRSAQKAAATRKARATSTRKAKSVKRPQAAKRSTTRKSPAKSTTARRAATQRTTAKRTTKS